MHHSLTSEASNLINSYLNLPISAGCSCPYFNNRRTKIRGGLSALVGKGTPEDIATEAKIIALRKKIKIENLSSDALKKFLVENGLGIDCSGFAYHLLNQESLARGTGKLGSHIKMQGGLIRKFLHRLRPDKNTNVEVLTRSQNSHEVSIENAQAGDIIVMIKTGIKKTYNHILVIKNISHNAAGNKIITYVHSYSWPTDGKYDHGIRVGEISIENPSLKLIQAIWTENGYSNKENYTFLSAIEAEEVSIRRLNIFT